MATKKTRKSGGIVFEVEEKLYPIEAVQSAAYAFTDRAHASVESAGAGKLRITLEPKTASGSAALKGDFRNELLHQVVRARVSSENRKIREYIVTKALVSALPPEVIQAQAGQSGAPAPKSGPGAPEGADPELEKEIDRLLTELEGQDPAQDPLGVTASWEESHPGQASAQSVPEAKGREPGA